MKEQDFKEQAEKEAAEVLAVERSVELEAN